MEFAGKSPVPTAEVDPCFSKSSVNHSTSTFERGKKTLHLTSSGIQRYDMLLTLHMTVSKNPVMAVGWLPMTHFVSKNVKSSVLVLMVLCFSAVFFLPHLNDTMTYRFKPGRMGAPYQQ